MKLFGLFAVSALAMKEEKLATARVERVVRQLHQIIDNFYDEDVELAAQASDIGNRLISDWNKKYEKCGWGPEEEEEIEQEMRDDGRADMDDPCIASRQLTKSLARFAKKHLQPCAPGKEDAPAKFANKMIGKATRFGNKLQRRQRCPKDDEDESEE